jgi:hypothetical protein
MSGGWLVLAIVGAVLFVAFAVQVTARQLQRYPVDHRRAGPLVEISKETTWVVRPVEAEQLNSIVSESLSSDAVARSKLWPMLDELERSAPAGRGEHAGSTPTGSGRRRGRLQFLNDRIAALESAWGIDDEP